MSFISKIRFLFKRWPIKVYIFKRYENTIKIVEGRGRRVKEKVTLEDGESYHDYFEFYTFDDYIIRKIPTQGIVHAKNIDSTTVLYLYQADLDTFYPMKVSDKGLTVVVGDKEKIVFDPDILIEEDKAITIPYFVAEKTYDKDAWLSQQIVLAHELYRSKKGFFEKYGQIMISAVSVVIIFLISVYAMRSISNMFEDTSKALVKASNNFEKSSRYFEVLSNIIDKRYKESNSNQQNPIPVENNKPPP